MGQDAVGSLVHLPSPSIMSSSDTTTSLALGHKVFTPIANAFAEYLVAPWWKVAVIPPGVEDRDGVMMATTGLTAMTLVKESYGVKEGDWALVRAAAGGVGLILCQVRNSLHLDLPLSQSV